MALVGLRRRSAAPQPRPARVDAAGPLPRGLGLIEGFVTPAEAATIEAWVDAEVAWTGGALDGNRMQTWVEPDRPLPPWGVDLADRMVLLGLFDQRPDYLHLLAYPRGSGLVSHVDAEDLGDVVVGLTLRSSRVFRFTHPRHPPVRVLLQPGDLYVLRGAARRRWEHGVPADDVDVVHGVRHPRSDGLSATWRRARPDASWR